MSVEETVARARAVQENHQAILSATAAVVGSAPVEVQKPALLAAQNQIGSLRRNYVALELPRFGVVGVTSLSTFDHEQAVVRSVALDLADTEALYQRALSAHGDRARLLALSKETAATVTVKAAGDTAKAIASFFSDAVKKVAESVGGPIGLTVGALIVLIVILKFSKK